MWPSLLRTLLLSDEATFSLITFYAVGVKRWQFQNAYQLESYQRPTWFLNTPLLLRKLYAIQRYDKNNVIYKYDMK